MASLMTQSSMHSSSSEDDSLQLSASSQCAVGLEISINMTSERFFRVLMTSLLRVLSVFLGTNVASERFFRVVMTSQMVVSSGLPGASVTSERFLRVPMTSLMTQSGPMHSSSSEEDSLQLSAPAQSVVGLENCRISALVGGTLPLVEDGYMETRNSQPSICDTDN